MKTSPLLSVLADRIFWRIVALVVLLPILLSLGWLVIIIAIYGACRSVPSSSAEVGPLWRGEGTDGSAGVPAPSPAPTPNVAQKVAKAVANPEGPTP